MKKITVLLALAFLLTIPALALAGNGNRGGGFQGGGAQAGPGGFTGSGAPSLTVAEALDLGDDAWVTLTGRIEKRLGHERYQFSDATGTVVLDIDDDEWRGLTVGPEDVVEIQGEVDRHYLKKEIEVERIIKK